MAHLLHHDPLLRLPACLLGHRAALLAPFTVALLAIVVRSVALGVRGSAASQGRSHRRLSVAFGLASVVAPFAFGTVAGGLAQAALTPAPHAAPALAIRWTGPVALAVGALAVALCAALAAGFVTLRCARSDRPAVTERFRRRALASGIAVLVAMAIALGTVAASAPELWRASPALRFPSSWRQWPPSWWPWSRWRAGDT